jgi:hypothetical protein
MAKDDTVAKLSVNFRLGEPVVPVVSDVKRKVGKKAPAEVKKDVTVEVCRLSNDTVAITLKSGLLGGSETVKLFMATQGGKTKVFLRGEGVGKGQLFVIGGPKK